MCPAYVSMLLLLLLLLLLFIVCLSMLIVLRARRWVAPLPVAHQLRWQTIANYVNRDSFCAIYFGLFLLFLERLGSHVCKENLWIAQRGAGPPNRCARYAR